MGEENTAFLTAAQHHGAYKDFPLGAVRGLF